MQKRSNEGARRSLLFTLFVLGLVTVVAILPYQFRTEAGGKGLFQRTVSNEDAFPNYDIREAKGDDVQDALIKYRSASGKDASMIANTRDEFVRGENELRSLIPTLKIDYNTDLRIPEVIGPDVLKGRAFLTSRTTPAGTKHADVLLNFLKQNTSLVGASTQQIDALKVFADYTNPDGNLSWVELEQYINSVPVFRGGVKAGFTRQGEMIRVLNNLAPALDYNGVSKDFGSPVDAVRYAAPFANYELKGTDAVINAVASSDRMVKFGGGGDSDISAERMYFPTEPGVAVPAWRVLIWKPVNAYYVIVDAHTGTMLWRKNVVNDQTQPATYNVYSNITSLISTLDSPAPITPGPIDPSLGTQGVQVARTNVTLIGNEGLLSFNNLGWITDGTNGVNGHTDGNAVEAGLDIVAPDGIDAPQAGTTRVFNFAYNPPPGMPAPPLPITDPLSRSGAVTQLFYLCNRYHDIMYQLGFTELARNFQNDNFGRGGVAADRVRCEAQDSSGTNNANFSTPADGGRGRMQMFRFTNTLDNRDGTIDSDVVIHEFTHGLSNRLIGNGSGLGNNRGGSMGEGWSDFYASSLLSETTDPINGVYTTGAYVTFQVGAFGIGTNNTYYGIRRTPYAPIAFTGGPANRPHDPQTAGDVNTGCSISDGAFPPLFTGTCNEVHNGGEVWATMLFEVRAKFMTRLGQAVGNRKMLQITTDAMKLSANSPNFQTMRDSILTAAQNSAAAPEAGVDVSDVWAGMALRGMGFGATDNGTTVVQSFQLPNANFTTPFTVSDSVGDNDGFPEPGENVLLNVSVTNVTGNTVNNVTASVAGGGSANYGNMAAGATISRPITYTVPAATACGALQTVSITVSSDLGTNPAVQQSFRLGVPVGGAPVTFTSSTALTIPDSGVTVPYGTTIVAAGLTGNKNIKMEITGLTHTFPGDLDMLLVGPGGQKFSLLSDSGSTGDVSNLTFTLSDGAAAQPSETQWVAGDFKPVNITAGDTFAAPAPVGPYLEAPTAGAASFNSVFGSSGAAMNGTWTLYVVDDAGGDLGTMAGWKLTFEANDYACSLAPSNKAPFDFDGDHKSDISIFRSGLGEWWALKSSNGSTAAAQFGASTDKIVPGDFTGDGKADFAFFRPSTGFWFVLRSEDFSFFAFPFGTSGDVPAPADYDGDGKTDAAVFRTSNSTWIISKSGGGTTFQPFGQSGDVPVAADYDGDGKSDIAIYRPSLGQWWLLRSTAGTIAFTFGNSTDKTVPGDYTGDGKADVAIYRPSTGFWFILRSEDNSFFAFPFGTAGDVPAPGDYDGDGKTDATVFRPSNSTWFANRSSSTVLILPFGQAGDLPVPNAFVR